LFPVFALLRDRGFAILTSVLELEEALTRILGAVPPPVAERIPLSGAHGRVLAETTLATVDLPPFDNSAMDGYAVRAAEVTHARQEAPVCLKLAGKVAAGQTFGARMMPGTCVRLFTGSPLPTGADAVVMQEATRLETRAAGEVQILEPVKPWENVRLMGEDVKRGATLGTAGEYVATGRFSLLAAAGLAQVCVGRRPLVGLLATGSELKEPGEALTPGQIFESNRLSLAALVRAAGAIPRIFPLVPDALKPTRDALDAAFDHCDAVVSSGGVSVGDMDFVKQAFTEAGGSMEFWKVAVKPGRPFVFGRLKGKLLFGLPGNPVSALVTFLLLVRPALLRWQGATEISLPSQAGVLAESLANDGPRRHFLRVKLDASGRVFSAGLQASHALSSLATANGLVEVAPQTTLRAGATVPVLRWE
jgi:molybdopterin molybdotransferase